MWVALSCWKLTNSLVPASYQMGNWKWFKNIVENSPNEAKLLPISYMYHLAAFPVKVRWNNLNLIESSIRELDEHHRWKVVIWSVGSSPFLPSNFGMSEGSLVGTGGHLGLYRIGLFVNFKKSSKFNVARKGKRGRAWGFHPWWDGFPTFWKE